MLNKFRYSLLLLGIITRLYAQNTSLKVGDAGLPLILNNPQNTLQSISFLPLFK